MKKYGWQKICLILLLPIVALAFGRTETEAAHAEDHVPDGITMQEGFIQRQCFLVLLVQKPRFGILKESTQRIPLSKNIRGC